MKLTNDMRRTVANAMMKDAYVAEEAALKAKNVAFGDEFYHRVIATEEQEKVMRSLPRHFFSHQKDLHGYFSDCKPEHSRRRSWTLNFSKECPIPASFQWNATFQNTAEDYERVAALSAEQDELDDKREYLRREIAGALAAFTTVEKLRKEWPDTAKYLPAEPPMPTTTLPAIVLGDLIAKLASAGVPPQTAAQGV